MASAWEQSINTCCFVSICSLQWIQYGVLKCILFFLSLVFKLPWRTSHKKLLTLSGTPSLQILFQLSFLSIEAWSHNREQVLATVKLPNTSRGHKFISAPNSWCGGRMDLILIWISLGNQSIIWSFRFPLASTNPAATKLAADLVVYLYQQFYNPRQSNYDSKPL